MNRLARDGLLGQLATINLPICIYCLAAKSTTKPFGKATKTEFPLQIVHIVHAYICKPMNARASHRATYFITFIHY